MGPDGFCPEVLELFFQTTHLLFLETQSRLVDIVEFLMKGQLDTACFLINITRSTGNPAVMSPSFYWIERLVHETVQSRKG